MSRTGIVTPYRHCPRHGSALELAFDEAWDEEELSWWCNECLGEWCETYFTMREEARLPLKALFRRFVLHCPGCGSGRCHATCQGCCFQHDCNDCGLQFSFEAHRLSGPTLPAEDVRKLYDKIWLDENASRGFPEPQVELFPQLGIERYCKTHKDELLSFAVDHATHDERMRFGWFCSQPECGGILYPNYQRLERRRIFFSLTQGPAFHCFSCNHVEFDQTEDLLKPVCLTCGTRYQISFEGKRGPRGPRRME